MITKYSDIVPNKDQQTILELKKKKKWIPYHNKIFRV